MINTTLLRYQRITQTPATMSNQWTMTIGTVHTICRLCCTLDPHIATRRKDGRSMREIFSMYCMFKSYPSATWRCADGSVLRSGGCMPYVGRDLMQFPVIEP